MGRLKKVKQDIIVKVWQSRLKLDNWRIKTVAILPEQVMYDDDVPEEDRYFIGISIKKENMEAVIFYDTPMEEEDVVHELTHLKHPDWSEDKVNSYTDFIMSYYNDKFIKKRNG